jgi:hypothetical protein
MSGSRCSTAPARDLSAADTLSSSSWIEPTRDSGLDPRRPWILPGGSSTSTVGLIFSIERVVADGEQAPAKPILGELIRARATGSEG